MDRGSFVDTRSRALDSLKSALAGNAASQAAILEEPLQSQLKAIVEESEEWQAVMFERLVDLDAKDDFVRSKRARR